MGVGAGVGVGVSKTKFWPCEKGGTGEEVSETRRYCSDLVGVYLTLGLQV